MAPKKKRSDPNGMFAGMAVLLVDAGVQPRRLQIWKQKLEQMGASIEDKLSKNVTHVFAASSEALIEKIGRERLSRFNVSVLVYQWLEDGLSSGEKPSEAPYVLTLNPEGKSSKKRSPKRSSSITRSESNSSDGEKLNHKKARSSEEPKTANTNTNTNDDSNADVHEGSVAKNASNDSSANSNPVKSRPATPKEISKTDETPGFALPFSPPNQNSNITEIFGKLINIYRALGDDRRSFSYHKAVAVIEKLPFKIESVDQVRHLPAIGKSLQDHIQEIVNTGRLLKLEHFETDEKVRTISLFGEVWGIGPATALKLFEKGYRTLDDLKNEDSLTNSQRLGLEYFDDIKTRIPRDEVREMEILLQKAAKEILPGVDVVCGGSYRRGKPTCGDMDIVITHPDGKSHKGFLRTFVKHLKDMKFLREDLVFSIHSEEGTDSGVDTYFGLCTYPGRELRHRIDFKVYPRDIYAFGLIAWTGNDVLNRRLRILAESKGFRLDDTGLFPATHGSGDKRSTRASRSLHLRTEKEVFDFLGFPWFEPHERNL